MDYIVARTESLMAACYLLCLYASVRAHESPDRGGTSSPSLAAGLGMLSKESMATAPVAVVLIDRALLFPSFAEAFRARRSLYLGLCCFVADPCGAGSGGAASEFCGLRRQNAMRRRTYRSRDTSAISR